MAYVTIIKTPTISCATNDIVLSKNDVRYVNNISLVAQQIEMHLKKQIKDKKEAEKKGYEKGYKKGLEKSNSEAVNLFSEYLLNISDKVMNKLTIQKKTIIELAIEITKKIVSNIDAEIIIMENLTKIINNFENNEKIEIKLNTTIANVIRNKLQAKYSGSDKLLNIEINDNPNIDILDCIITTEHGVIDASFKEQIKLLESHLIRVL
jgi:flagellar biosynthesis/type III secretory pathway protein FliH